MYEPLENWRLLVRFAKWYLTVCPMQCDLPSEEVPWVSGYCTGQKNANGIYAAGPFQRQYEMAATGKSIAVIEEKGGYKCLVTPLCQPTTTRAP